MPKTNKETTNKKSYISYVNVKQGTDSHITFSHGNTLPLVQRPFGFASFAPQTNGSGRWFYHPSSRSFEGVRLTHQPSPWISEHAAIVMMPQTEFPNRDEGFRRTDFDVSEEVLLPHYMKYRLNRSFSTIELTPTEYGAHVKLKFDKDFDRFLSILPVGGIYGYTYDTENHRLLCYADCCIKGYFVFQFDADSIDEEKIIVECGTERHEGLCIEGDSACMHLALKKKEMEFTLATSFISCEQAAINLKNDSHYESFAALKQENEEIWNSYLGRVEISADIEKMKTFYTCMYRAFLFPHKAYEMDAQGNEVHFAPSDGTVKLGKRYTDNGFWDTYRTVYPFFSIVAKEEYQAILEGFIQDYVDGGWLPRWTAGDAKNCMPSTAIDAVITDAAVKGILSGELLEIAFQGMEQHANNDSPLPAFGREGCSDYLKLGYVPCDKYRESVNLTLDAAYFDYCLAVVADILGYADKKEKYLARAKNYAHVFDSETGFMRGKDASGAFRSDFDPISWGLDYTEAAAWQTSLAVQHDLEGLAELMGGKDQLIAYLDALFASPAEYRVGGYHHTIHEMSEMAACDWGQCAISNQPSFHIPFIYAYLGEKEKADFWLEKICREGFSYKNDGFPGDEDNGSMAIWYIFAQLGLYPICPGKAEYTVTTPMVQDIKILGKSLALSGNENLITHDALLHRLQ